MKRRQSDGSGGSSTTTSRSLASSGRKSSCALAVSAVSAVSARPGETLTTSTGGGSLSPALVPAALARDTSVGSGRGAPSGTAAATPSGEGSLGGAPGVGSFFARSLAGDFVSSLDIVSLVGSAWGRKPGRSCGGSGGRG